MRLAAFFKEKYILWCCFPTSIPSTFAIQNQMHFLWRPIIITFIFYFPSSWTGPFCRNHQCWSPGDAYSTGYILVMSVTVKDAKGVRLIFRSGYGRMGTTSGPPIVFRIKRNALVIRASASSCEMGTSSKPWNTGLHDHDASYTYIDRSCWCIQKDSWELSDWFIEA